MLTKNLQKRVFLGLLFALCLQFLPLAGVDDVKWNYQSVKAEPSGPNPVHSVGAAGGPSTSWANQPTCSWEGTVWDNARDMVVIGNEKHITWWQKRCIVTSVAVVTVWEGWYATVSANDPRGNNYNAYAEDDDIWNIWHGGNALTLSVLPRFEDVVSVGSHKTSTNLRQIVQQSVPNHCGAFYRDIKIRNNKVDWSSATSWRSAC
ncbi:MAG: hypothetical protein AAF702_23240 [Chloroflexota bacterium]